MAADSHKELQKSVTFGNWVRKDIQYSQFQNYELTYAHFVRFPTPFSWGNWQPGSSPGNTFIIYYTLWRNAKHIIYLSYAFLPLSIFATFLPLSNFETNIIYFSYANDPIISSQSVGANNMHDIIAYYKLLANNFNPTSVRKKSSKLWKSRRQLSFPKEQRPLTQKHTQRHCYLTKLRFMAKSKKVSNKSAVAQPSNKINHQQILKSIHSYKILAVIKINDLLKCQRLLYQIRFKLIMSSWWRDKISW